ncbi:restriction endonuclease fold toxin [Luteipulveratus flavus]|uniref:Restriction endonuclease fold toxin n=1 Tax=Luteipulveratus flavus TaxID=3031728 RepID=A0ABT6C8D0_9MICO|nr:restriction endonuclease fold toxin [Luteipulveratus sp. YIM 133296]MDF8265189.1 restriction endonuclease fold toxin [Luteipulveratus sp. YIM 133296]
MSLAIGGVAEVDDGQLIRDAVVDLREAAGAVLTHAGNIKRAWSGLATAYHAPEQQLVLRAMDQPESRAATLRDAVGKAAKALNTYSWECDRLSGVQTRLVADLVTFDLDRQRIQAANSGDGSHQTDLLNRENALEGRLNRFHADLDLAQIICRNAMNDLWGEDDYQRVGETHVFDKTVYGFTGDGYHQMTRAGRTPWGAPTMWRDIHPSVIRLRQSQGSLESGKQYADALLSLNGTYGPGRQAAAGSGFAQTGLDLLVFSAQMSGMRVDPAGESRGRLFGMLKSMVGVDTARTDPNGTVGALSVDLLLSLSTGGGGSAAKAFLETASLSLAGRAPAQATRISALASADRALTRGAMSLLQPVPEGTFRGLADAARGRFTPPTQHFAGREFAAFGGDTRGAISTEMHILHQEATEPAHGSSSHGSTETAGGHGWPTAEGADIPGLDANEHARRVGHRVYEFDSSRAADEAIAGKPPHAELTCHGLKYFTDESGAVVRTQGFTGGHWIDVSVGSHSGAPGHADSLGHLVKDSTRDAAADSLAARMEGVSRVKFSDGPANEFDVVSKDYVVQSKPANFRIGKDFRAQAKATFEVSLATGRRPYFHFEGTPDRDVIRALERYADRYAIDYVLDTVPLGG